MTSLRRLTVLLVGMILALGGGATAWLTQAGATAVPSSTRTPPGNQPNGVNFTIHSEVDPNFCVEDIPAPAVPASEASMSECVNRDGQHWTFADAADGSVVIIGGNTGKCLDFSAKAPSLVSVTPCTFKGAEKFYFAPSGQIESTSGKKCLEPSQAEQNAAIEISKCQTGVPLQIFELGH
jgi:hypothetical protein